MLAFKLSAEAVDSVTKPVAPTIKNVAIFISIIFCDNHNKTPDS
ncbi:hypothetical protein SPAR33_1159 [Streptococcus pneumoniae GA13723]|nr:hypothetical protein SPAR33_1159 [Streptococcus pneumoniae GA13723]